MSYSLVPYLIDLEALRKAVGSKDEALIAAVMRDEPDSFADEAEGGEISMSRALRDLVMAAPPDAKSAHQYGYALKHLCEHLGERLDSDCWESIHWDVIEATGMEEVLTQSKSPVPLPAIESFPVIGHLKAAEIAALIAKQGGGPLKTAAPSGRKPKRSLRSRLIGLMLSKILPRSYPTDDELQEPLEEYRSWLQEAVTKRQSLVFFYH